MSGESTRRDFIRYLPVAALVVKASVDGIPAVLAGSLTSNPSSAKKINQDGQLKDWQKLFVEIDNVNFFDLCCPDRQMCIDGKFVSEKPRVVTDSELYQGTIPEILSKHLEPLLATYTTMSSITGAEVAGGFRSTVTAAIKVLKDYQDAIGIFLDANAKTYKNVLNEFHIPGRGRGFEDRKNWREVLCPNLRFYHNATVEELVEMGKRDLSPVDLRALTDDRVKTFQNIADYLEKINKDHKKTFVDYHIGLAGKATDETKQVENFLVNANGWEERIAKELSVLMGLGKVSGLDYIEMLGMRSGRFNQGSYKDKFSQALDGILDFDWQRMEPLDAAVAVWKRLNSQVKKQTSFTDCERTATQVFEKRPYVVGGICYHNIFQTLLNRMGMLPQNVLFEEPNKNTATSLEIPGKGYYLFGWDEYGELKKYVDRLFKGKHYDFTRPYLNASFPTATNQLPSQLRPSLSSSGYGGSMHLSSLVLSIEPLLEIEYGADVQLSSSGGLSNLSV